MPRHIDADKIIYIWLIDADGKEHDGVTLQSVIDKMPTADVRENVRGEWIDCGIHGDWAWEQDGHGNYWHIWKCSKCEHTTDHCSNYCPNCGADMRGGKE